MSTQLFQQQILAWFDSHGRKNLPWQQEISPYRVWLSEIMLQQTQVSTVIPYFNRFIERYPNIHQLASAPIDTVLQLWSGLGYYARARNLHKTAIIINEQFEGFPNDLTTLMALPGIGRSTAGAILSIAFNQNQPILDGNVKRVLARYHAISGWTGQAKVNKKLWEISTKNTPTSRCANYTQAMMDLGATVCTRSKPDCTNCPIQTGCQAIAQNKVNELPTPKKAKRIPIKTACFLLLKNKENAIFLEKRYPLGIWGGLWSFPEFNSYQEIQYWIQEENINTISVAQLEKRRHTFSHYHLDYNVFIITTDTQTNKVMDANQSVWYNSEQIFKIGLPAPIKKILQEQFREENNDENG